MYFLFLYLTSLYLIGEIKLIDLSPPFFLITLTLLINPACPHDHPYSSLLSLLSLKTPGYTPHLLCLYYNERTMCACVYVCVLACCLEFNNLNSDSAAGMANAAGVDYQQQVQMPPYCHVAPVPTTCHLTAMWRLCPPHATSLPCGCSTRHMPPHFHVAAVPATCHLTAMWRKYPPNWL